MMHQTLHGIPCVQGYLGRRIETTLGDRLPFDLRRLREQKTLLAENRVKYVVLQKRWLKTYASAVTAAYANTYEKIYEDGEEAVFRVYAS